MINKTLHYIWLGNNKTDLANKCIDSFHKYMNDYNIIEWNESNINELELNSLELQYYNIWYNRKKFAFCSDLLRLHILNKYGGVYVDCDVEFLKHLPDEFLQNQFLSRITPRKTVCSGCIWGCQPNDKLVVKSINELRTRLLDSGVLYGKKWIFNTIFLSIFNEANKTPDKVISFNDYIIYPTEYFCPKDQFTKEINITDKTIAIHHFALSWKK